VTSYDKDAAQILVGNFLSKFAFSDIDIYIRINDSESTYFLDDVNITKELPISGYVLPKASKASIDALNNISNKQIIPIIETPMAVLKIEDIASSLNVKALLLGAEDLTKDLGVSRTTNGMEILYARSKVIMTAAAYNIESIDTPFTDKDDDEGLVFDTLNAKGLGFTSKSSIHPNHVVAINKIFSPSDSEILHAKRIIKKSESSDKGAFSLDGKMIDLPVIQRAQKLLDKAKKYNLL